MGAKTLFLAPFLLAGCVAQKALLPAKLPAWIIQPVDDGSRHPESRQKTRDIGRISAGFFDGKNGFHAVYSAYNQLHYIYEPNIAAQKKFFPHRFETIPFPFDPRATSASIAVDKSGRPHVIYYGKNGIQYVLLTTNGWVLGLLTDHADLGKPWAFLFDSKDVPVLIFSHQKEGLAMTRPTANGWKEEEIPLREDAVAGEIACLGAKIDREGTLHLAYLLNAKNKATLWYTRRYSGASPAGVPGPMERGSWEPARPMTDFTVRHLSNCRMAFTADAQPVYAWVGWTKKEWDGNEKLVFGERRAGGWRQTIIEEPIASGQELARLDFAVDGSGRGHLVLTNPNTLNIAYFSTDAKRRWLKTVIAPAPMRPRNPSLSVDQNGRPWVLFQDGRTDTLRLARLEH
ncbi:MAG: hypothetical protein HYT79_07710 [Elusimicrobia bacterium]|nr:hypothetical protein [Elusimicrobiota bacterium]